MKTPALRVPGLYAEFDAPAPRAVVELGGRTPPLSPQQVKEASVLTAHVLVLPASVVGTDAASAGAGPYAGQREQREDDDDVTIQAI